MASPPFPISEPNRYHPDISCPCSSCYKHYYDKYGESYLCAQLCYRKYLEEERLASEIEKYNSTTEPRTGPRQSPYYFITFTLDNEHAEVPEKKLIERIVALASSKSVKVMAYYGCIEYTEKLRPHAHVLFYVPKAGKKGFGESHIKTFYKYGNIDIRKPDGNINSSLANLIKYIEKIEDNKPKKIYFGDKNKLPCLTNDVIQHVNASLLATDLTPEPDLEDGEDI